MDGSAFDAVARAVPIPGSRRRAVVAVLGGTFAALGLRDTTGRKKKGKGKKPRCPECDTCPAPLDTCPQRFCCSCYPSGGGASTKCTYFPTEVNPTASCADFCPGQATITVSPTPGQANMCTTGFDCVSLKCPVL
jgi:hypothetical protein